MDLCSRIPHRSWTWYRARGRVQCQEKRALLLAHEGAVPPFPLALPKQMMWVLAPQSCPKPCSHPPLMPSSFRSHFSSLKYPFNVFSSREAYIEDRGGRYQCELQQWINPLLSEISCLPREVILVSIWFPFQISDLCLKKKKKKSERKVTSNIWVAAWLLSYLAGVYGKCHLQFPRSIIQF